VTDTTDKETNERTETRRVSSSVRPSLRWSLTLCVTLFSLNQKQTRVVVPTPWGTGGTFPHFYKWLGTVSRGEQQTRN